jgi:hypothetical protein
MPTLQLILLAFQLRLTLPLLTKGSLPRKKEILHLLLRLPVGQYLILTTHMLLHNVYADRPVGWRPLLPLQMKSS